jgi:hypothetical protein
LSINPPPSFCQADFTFSFLLSSFYLWPAAISERTKEETAVLNIFVPSY